MLPMLAGLKSYKKLAIVESKLNRLGLTGSMISYIKKPKDQSHEAGQATEESFDDTCLVNPQEPFIFLGSFVFLTFLSLWTAKYFKNYLL